MKTFKITDIIKLAIYKNDLTENHHWKIIYAKRYHKQFIKL